MTVPHIVSTVAILGGTGKEGKGLAWRWAKAGYRVIIGSRSIEKATAAAQLMTEELEGTVSIIGTTNHDAAKAADMVVLAVPYSAHRTILEEIKDVMQGKILVDVTVPLPPAKGSDCHISTASSAALEASGILGDGAQVTSAFQNISYKLLYQEEPMTNDVLVTGTSKAARHETLKLVSAAGFTGWDAGPIENAIVTEGLTRILIYINREYGTKYAGIKITGADNGQHSLFSSIDKNS